MILKNIASISGANIFKGLVQFLVNMLVAHFVIPAQFGLVTFSLPFISFIALLTDMGLSSAIVRHPQLSRRQIGSAFTLMLAIGAVFALVLAVAGWPIESATHMAGLTWVMLGMAGSVVLSIAAVTPRAVLERHLKYHIIAMVEAGAAVAALIMATISAFAGAGVWSLVLFYLVMQLIRAVAFIWLVRKEMDLNLNWREVVPMLSFGGWVLASNVLNFAARNSDNVLIGGFLGSTALGLYGLAYQFMLIPMMMLAWPASSVLMSTLSRMKDETADKKSQVVAAIITATSLISFPAMIYLTFGMAVPAETFLPHSWNGVAPLITFLAPVGAIQSIAVYNGPVLLSNDKARLQFIAGVVNSVLLLSVFLITLQFGITVLVKTYAVVAITISCGLLWLTVQQSQMAWSRFAQSLMPAGLATLAGVAAVAVSNRFHIITQVDWLVATGVYAVAVLAVYGVMFRRVVSNLKILANKGQNVPAIEEIPVV